MTFQTPCGCMHMDMGIEVITTKECEYHKGWSAALTEFFMFMEHGYPKNELLPEKKTTPGLGTRLPCGCWEAQRALTHMCDWHRGFRDFFMSYRHAIDTNAWKESRDSKILRDCFISMEFRAWLEPRVTAGSHDVAFEVYRFTAEEVVGKLGA